MNTRFENRKMKQISSLSPRSVDDVVVGWLDCCRQHSHGVSPSWKPHLHCRNLNVCPSSNPLTGPPSCDSYSHHTTTLLCHLKRVLRSSANLLITPKLHNIVPWSSFVQFHVVLIQHTGSMGCLRPEEYLLTSTSLTTSVDILLSYLSRRVDTEC